MIRIFSAVLTFLLTISTQAESLNGQQILNEYERIHQFVANAEPEFEVGGLLKGKQFGDYKLLWKIAKEKGDSEVIRIYRDKGQKEQAFEVSYFRNELIVPGKTVIRRFIGPASTGWRNDTVDFADGRYLGSQGTERPYLDQRDSEILAEWNIRFLE